MLWFSHNPKHGLKIPHVDTLLLVKQWQIRRGTREAQVGSVEAGRIHSSKGAVKNVKISRSRWICSGLFSVFLGMILLYQHLANLETREFLEVWRWKARTKYWFAVSIISRFPCPNWKEEAKEDEVDTCDVPMILLPNVRVFFTLESENQKPGDTSRPAITHNTRKLWQIHH